MSIAKCAKRYQNDLVSAISIDTINCNCFISRKHVQPRTPLTGPAGDSSRAANRRALHPALGFTRLPILSANQTNRIAPPIFELVESGKTPDAASSSLFWCPVSENHFLGGPLALAPSLFEKPEIRRAGEPKFFVKRK